MRFKDEEGAAIAEFALVLPLLAFLLFGMIEFGLVLFNKQVITNASREAARAGIVVDLDTGGTNYDTYVADIAMDYCSNYLIDLGGSATPVVTPTYTAKGFGNDLTVEVNYDYHFLVFGELAKMFGASSWSTVNLYARAVMRYE
jgi:Flp pilus assembly protein TadG